MKHLSIVELSYKTLNTVDSVSLNLQSDKTFEQSDENQNDSSWETQMILPRMQSIQCYHAEDVEGRAQFLEIFSENINFFLHDGFQCFLNFLISYFTKIRFFKFIQMVMYSENCFNLRRRIYVDGDTWLTHADIFRKTKTVFHCLVNFLLT